MSDARDTVLTLVRARLHTALGEPDASAAVTFLGAERVEVLRFREGDLLRYATVGMSGRPMTDPGDIAADPVRGPRAELILSVRMGGARTEGARTGGAHAAGARARAVDPGVLDKVLRPLAVLAASPQVEGVVVAPGASLDVGEPLWPGASFTSVLVAEGGGLVEDLELDAPMDPVRFLPLLPMTPNEAAWKRVHGAEALRERWLTHGTDLRDPLRGGVPLGDGAGPPGDGDGPA
ncbi:suppressor of fused domain protein [Streptomyces sp. B1866]|uniref:suppressor of fused domain protein n=1 Tax=Streptomyces sp. B1866 TaxID=3075431 RepID=UPI00289098CC|nr:suppressor of fused domain protein [Streptomyces sp. B1866]MDT3396217.1 suppressor of fused domain protein [Streptomyces sp. B1866]